MLQFLERVNRAMRGPEQKEPEMPSIENSRNDFMEYYRQYMQAEHQQALSQINRAVSPWMGDDLAQANRTSSQRPAAKEPTAVAVEAEPIDADYAALVADLGLNSGPVDVERFKGWLREQGLTIYQRDEVQEYLHCKYKVPVGNISSRVHWGWRPLREQDRVSGAADSHNGAMQPSTAPYAKPIPYPVLLTIKAVRDTFPTARFYVSDEMQAERIPDPFLLVHIGGQSFVIERWDEPSFRAKK